MKKRILPLVLALACAPWLPAIEIVAHRGASYDAPENTVAAFNLAFEQKSDSFECDIYLTKDGRIVALHDKDTKRTSNGQLTPATATLEELQKLDAGTWKNSKYAGEKMPSMEEIMAALPDGKRIYIELKGGVEIIPELKRVIDASGKKKEQITIIDFKLPSCKAAREAFPDVEVLYLSGGKKNRETGKVEYVAIDELIRICKDHGFEGLDLNFNYPLTNDIVKKIKDAGLKLAVWTVNKPEDAKRMAALGVDSITTDRPLLIREALNL